MAVKTYPKGQKLKLSANFNQSEFDCKCKNSCNITKIDDELITRLQLLRNIVGAPINITSGYRCAAYNKTIGGISNSNHVKGMAADIYVTGITPATLAKYSELAGFREIICYQVNENFCHVGTRSDKWYAITTDGGKTYRTVQTFGGGYTTVKAGTKNVAAVKKLQTILKQKKYLGADKKPLTIDGSFGANTTFAVKAFQKDNKIAVDGVVGVMTWKKLGI